MILIADPEEAIRDSLNYVLSEEGYITHTAASEEKVISALHLHRYDLIITEISLIPRSAETFFDLVNSGSSPPGILVITSYEDVSNVLSLLHFRTFEHLVKPFEFDELTDRINTLLRTSSHRTG